MWAKRLVKECEIGTVRFVQLLAFDFASCIYWASVRGREERIEALMASDLRRKLGDGLGVLEVVLSKLTA